MWSVFEEVVGGGGDSNGLYMVVGGRADLSNECLDQGRIDSIAEDRCDVLRDRCAIPGDNEGLVLFLYLLFIY